MLGPAAAAGPDMPVVDAPHEAQNLAAAGNLDPQLEYRCLVYGPRFALIPATAL